MPENPRINYCADFYFRTANFNFDKSSREFCEAKLGSERSERREGFSPPPLG